MEGCPILSTRIQWYPLAFHRKTGSCPILSTRIQSYPLAFHRKTGSCPILSTRIQSYLLSDPLETNRFRWKSSFSIGERLRKIPRMLDEGVESRSDGVHRIHWKRIDSDGKVHFLFVRDLEKFHACWMRGWKVVPMESIGSIGNQ